MGTRWPRSAQFSAVTPRAPLPLWPACRSEWPAGCRHLGRPLTCRGGPLGLCLAGGFPIAIKKAVSKHKIETEPAASQLWQPRRVHRWATPAPSGSPVGSNKCLLHARQTQIRRWVSFLALGTRSLISRRCWVVLKTGKDSEATEREPPSLSLGRGLAGTTAQGRSEGSRPGGGMRGHRSSHTGSTRQVAPDAIGRRVSEARAQRWHRGAGVSRHGPR